jgi:hypothetical protein
LPIAFTHSWLQVVLTHVRRERLSEPGDTVVKRFRWRSEGLNACPASSWSGGGFCSHDWPCAHDSLSCLAGTGDFRIGTYRPK